MSEDVIVALGSNEGNRYQNLVEAKTFLKKLSTKKIQSSSIYESEPIGPSDRPYYNAVVIIHTDVDPHNLLRDFKEYESSCGRDLNARRWSSRIIDLDIIAYGKEMISTEKLMIPHAEYSRRLFVLLPMEEIIPDWKDPQNGRSLKEMIKAAPEMYITKMDYDW